MVWRHSFTVATYSDFSHQNSCGCCLKFTIHRRFSHLSVGIKQLKTLNSAQRFFFKNMNTLCVLLSSRFVHQAEIMIAIYFFCWKMGDWVNILNKIFCLKYLQQRYANFGKRAIIITSIKCLSVNCINLQSYLCSFLLSPDKAECVDTS